MVTRERVIELLSYDPATGEIRWRVDRQRARKGEIAGIVCPTHGYRIIGIDYGRYRASRLAWLIMTGEFPENVLDHVDRCRTNDSWANLRQATVKQNAENKGISDKNTSGVRGVSWIASRKKWAAHITHAGKAYNLGRYATKEDAISARKAAEKVMFTHV